MALSAASIANSPLTVQQIAHALAAAGLADVTLRDLQTAAVRNALARKGGNKTQAALELGIAVRTLQRQVKRWRLGSPDDRSAT